MCRWPEDQAARLCLSSHRQDLERARVADVLMKVQREAMELEERRWLRVER
jgi:hypothetical protein